MPTRQFMNIRNLYQDLNLKNNDVIVFGCSFGPDSMALFRSLLSLRDDKNIKLVCAHVNHGKRKESEQEKEDLEQFCIKHQVLFEYIKIDHYGDDNFHNEARNIRYHFFEKIVEKYHAQYLMTAHHGDDLMETILMRLVRGTTLEGYSGFKKLIHYGNYILYRPFINYTKQDLLKYVKDTNTPYAIDVSNDSDVYTRNRYRKVVLPFLKKEDPLVHQKFYKFSQEIESTASFIEREALKAKKQIFSKNRIMISKFLSLDIVIQKKVLEDSLKEFYQDDLILINDRHIQLILKLMHSRRANASVTLPNDVMAIKSYNYLLFQKLFDIISNYEIELNSRVVLPNGHSLEIVQEETGNSNNITRLSSKDLALPLRVRTRKYGDIMAIKGGGHQKLKNIFINMKISAQERDIWPVVVDSKDRIVFIPGLKKSKYDRKKDEFYDIILKYM